VAGTPEGQAERANVSGAIEDWNAAARQTMRVEHHAECDRSRTKTSRRCAPAESARTNRDASCASACPRKGRPPPQLRHPCPPQRSNLPPQETTQRWRRGSLRTRLPQKPDVRPTLSCGSTCRQRSITSPKRRATARRSAVPTCVRKKQSPLKIAPRRPRNIPEVKSKGSGTRRHPACFGLPSSSAHLSLAGGSEEVRGKRGCVYRKPHPSVMPR
jgi:hypothetical protein